MGREDNIRERLGIRTLIELIEGTGTHRHLLLETTLREGNSVISLR